MFLKPFSTHFTNLAMGFVELLKRWYDQGFRLNRQYTRQKIQEDYVDEQTGSAFTLEGRYTNMLTISAIVFFFGPGMPILYPIAALYFFIGFFIDKILLYYFNRRSMLYD